MAITGLIGVGYVIAHMAGNLLFFKGAEAINAYGAMLKANPLVLWGARGVLLSAVILHVLAAWQLTQRSHAARPVGYEKKEPQVSTFASRTMRWGGLLLLVFIVFHILHLTTGHIRPAGYFVKEDIYGNLQQGFQIWWVALFYMLAMVFLGFHLFHGFWSAFRSLGAAQQSPTPLRKKISVIIAIVIWAGFTSIPLAVWAGLVQ